jgi:hypothetical protein
VAQALPPVLKGVKAHGAIPPLPSDAAQPGQARRAVQVAALGSSALLGRLARSLAHRLANGLARGLGLASRRLLGGPASRSLLDLPFHYPLSHWNSLFLFVSISLKVFESPSNKKMMCKFEDFVDSKLQNISCERVYSIQRVARNPQFSRVSNALADHLHISPPLAADFPQRRYVYISAKNCLRAAR